MYVGRGDIDALSGDLAMHGLGPAGLEFLLDSRPPEALRKYAHPVGWAFSTLCYVQFTVVQDVVSLF